MNAMKFGEFFDGICRCLNRDDNICGIMALGGWKLLLGQNGEWREKAGSSLSRKLVLEMAQAVADEGRKVLGFTDGAELHHGRLQEFHAALHLIYQKAGVHGIAVRLEEINVPLTPSESLEQWISLNAGGED
jgi:hypothetical protein